MSCGAPASDAADASAAFVSATRRLWLSVRAGIFCAVFSRSPTRASRLPVSAAPDSTLLVAILQGLNACGQL